jgi:hypothetical protein
MDDTRQEAIAVAEEPSRVAATRDCTRCDGTQHLVAETLGMGKYRCDTCEMVVGFDLAADDPEFLVSRGLPSRYTKDVFGERVTAPERRLEPDATVV